MGSFFLFSSLGRGLVGGQFFYGAEVGGRGLWYTIELKSDNNSALCALASAICAIPLYLPRGVQGALICPMITIHKKWQSSVTLALHGIALWGQSLFLKSRIWIFIHPQYHWIFLFHLRLKKSNENLGSYLQENSTATS